MKTIGIIGTRRKNEIWHYRKVEQEFLKCYEEGDVICSGLCPKGADKFALHLSKVYNTKTLWFPADWKKYGKAAGFKRNTDIAFKSDILIALVSDDRTGGTEDTIKKFLAFNPKKELIVLL